MFKRPLFWLGLLLGSLVTFGARQRRSLPNPAAPLGSALPKEVSHDPMMDLVGEAVVACDDAGNVTYTNAAARALFGPEGTGFFHLCYPSGQPVPPGQQPLARARRTGQAMEGAGYLCVSASGETHVLDIRAHLRPNGGGAVAAIRDVTALGAVQAREAKAQGREQALRVLCRRLSAAPDAGELTQALVESAVALTQGLPQVRARLYAYDSGTRLLTRLASAPPEQPARPKSLRQAQPPSFPFDAAVPLLWSLYVERQPAVRGDVTLEVPAALAEETIGSACALPLLASGVPLGHLSVTCPAAEAFADTDLRASLDLLASIAALALTGPRQAAQAADLAAQVEALRAVIRAVGERTEPEVLADLVSAQIRRVIGAEVCTVAVAQEGGLHLLGKDYQDALLFPERYAQDNPALRDAALTKAVQTGKAVQRIGVKNPSFESGLWRAYAGQSGQYSVLAVPLAAGQGGLTAYVAGSAAFSEAQIKFLETLAALVSAALSAASRSAALAEA